jgi:carboxypeptidase Q
VVSSWVELGEQGETAEGKIVLLNPPFKGYSQTVAYRTFGATLAAKLGAVAVLVRSVTPFSISSPHTGSQSRPQSISAEWAQRMGVPPLFVGNYSDVPQIPAAALAAEDTALLARLQARGRRVRVRLHMGAQNWGDVTSRNTIVELEGTVRPDEVVIFGGHIDSWDVGQGAIDDAGPSLVCLQAVLAMLRSGLRPYRTIRLVFFTAEEIGLYGGSQHYANQLAQGVDKVHLVAELDHGIFNPVGISLQAELQVMQVAIYTASLIAATGATQVVSRRTSLSDLNDFPSKHNVPSMSLIMVRASAHYAHHLP